MCYQFNRLFLTDHRHNAGPTSRLAHLFESMDTTFQEDNFSGADSIFVLEFLTRIVEEADMLSISEG